MWHILTGNPVYSNQCIMAKGRVTLYVRWVRYLNRSGS